MHTQTTLNSIIPFTLVWIFVFFDLEGKAQNQPQEANSPTLNAIQQEYKNLLSYWQENTPDEKNGGFYGRIDGNQQIIEDAPKSLVLNSRILWTFAAAYNFSGEETYLQTAQRAYAYLTEHFLDPEFGGVYWQVDYQGNPLDTDKQIYAQSFGIYALSEYYLATKQEEAKREAIRIFELVEKYSFDPQKGGYQEGFNRQWKPKAIHRLGQPDSAQTKNMNTHLHLLEAYTNLYKIWQDHRLKKQLKHLNELFIHKFLDKKTGHYWAFFDRNWKLSSKMYSYGHDIEASWLLCRTSEVLNDPALHQKNQKIALKVADRTILEGLDQDGGLFNQGLAGQVTDPNKDWWPQAEALIGFVNAFQINQDSIYLKKMEQVWSFIAERLIDQKHGEWFSRTSQEGKPMLNADKIGPWKAPYHNVRACIEVLRRMKPEK